MKLPPVQPASFERGFTLFGAKPFALAEVDFKLHYHCDNIAMQSAAPEVLGTSLRIAESILRAECRDRGIVVPPVHESLLATVSAEMLEAGATWDIDIAKRLKGTNAYKAYHAVFVDWSKKKPRPELAYHGAARMFRIFELLLQPL